jgi:hypothetical protein
MNTAYTDLGAHSVIYIAFGTYFFPLPQSARHLEILIEEILAHGFRLVFALSSDSAGVSEEFKERVAGKGGNAIFPEWTDQLRVLEHPVSFRLGGSGD